MKIDAITAITIAAGAAALFAAWRLYASGAIGSPPSSQQYHARQNPNGYVFIPNAWGGGQWQAATPNGETIYWADVL